MAEKKIVEKKLALDIGAGSRPLRIDGYDVKTLDARAEVKPDFVGDIAKIKVPDGSFDLVHASHVLEHVKRAEVYNVLKEWRRILVDEGELRIVVPDLEVAAIELLSCQTSNDTFDILWGAQNHCVHPDTKILMEDLTYKKAKLVQAGDSIVAFDEVNKGNRRRLRKATVSSVIKRQEPICEVIFENGDKVLASATHKWLMVNGLWVMTKDMGDSRYPSKQYASKLCSIVDAVEFDYDYKVGYLSGAFSGDGYGLWHPKRGTWLGIKVTEKDFIDRINDFVLSVLDCKSSRVKTGICKFEKKLDQYRVDVHGEEAVKLLKKIHKYEDTENYKRGFLAGFFDAEGTIPKDSGSYAAYTNTDEYLVKLTLQWLQDFGFKTNVLKRSGTNRDVYDVRVNGGRSEVIRFFQEFRPAIIRKRECSWVGRSPWTDKAKVKEVKHVGVGDVISIQTSEHTLIVDGYLTHNSFNFHYTGYTRQLLEAVIVKYGFEVKEIVCKDRCIYMIAIKQKGEYV